VAFAAAADTGWFLGCFGTMQTGPPPWCEPAAPSGQVQRFPIMRQARSLRSFGVLPHRLFFGLALGQGAAAIAAWQWLDWAPAHGAAGHGHEMIFGQALAVIAGYLLTRTARWQVRLTALAWVAARLAAIWPEVPAGMLAVVSVAATGAIALAASRTFLRGVKRGGNMVFPVVLGAIAAADVWFHLGAMDLVPGGTWPGLAVGIGAVVLLIAAMGGRLLSAAASGAAQKAGKARIPPQHGVERALLALLALGLSGQGFAAPAVVWTVPLILAGALLCLRIALWAPGLRHAGGDVMALAAGQVWLAIGLVAWAAPLAGLPVAGLSALHVALVGGVGGTLLVMMMRSAAQREARAMPRRAAPIVAALMAAAALSRGVGAPEWTGTAASLWMAASMVAAASVFGRRWSQLAVTGTGSRQPAPRQPGSPAPR
jgi:uncharacterized protein involved in response to NO